MKVLVTGGSGYIGSHVSKMLYEQGHEPVVFDKVASQRPWASPDWLAITGDINNKWQLDLLFEKHKFDAVIHLAASSEVGTSVTEPLKYYQNNVGGSASVLEHCVKYGVDKFVFSSTSSVYGEIEIRNLPTREDHPKNPQHSYGSSKWAVECMLRDVSYAHNLRSVSLRYFNASGASPDSKIGEARINPTHLIPSLQEVVLGNREQFIIYGSDYRTIDGTAVRDFTHVWDIADAHLKALEYLDQGGATDYFNIGAGSGKSVLQMVTEFKAQIDVDIPVKMAERRKGDIPINYADISKAKTIMGWEPKLSDRSTIIQDTIRWYRSRLYSSLINQVDK